MKLAHLILAHDNPLQLERLVKRLVYPDTDVFIHLDKKRSIREYNHLEALGDVFFIRNRVSVGWGDYSMVDATLKSFQEILKKDDGYSHINLLSGNCYPLKDAGTIQEYLFAHADTSFMRYRSIYEEWQESVSRLTKYNLGDFRFPLKFKVQDLMNKFLPPRKIPMHLTPYGFSQWMTITPECAAYALQYLEKHPSVRRFFKFTWAVDELVFQTVLLNSPLKEKIVNDHLRYIKFVPKASRPNTLTMEDAEVLVQSGKFYARKFSLAEDSKIFDFLDRVALDESKLHRKQAI